MDELERRLRAIARESLDREAATVRVDDDLAALRARSAARPAAVPEPGRSWSRLAVAATLALFATGAVVLLATRNGGDEVVAPLATELPSSTTLPNELTTTTNASTPTTGPTTVVTSTTVPSPTSTTVTPADELPVGYFERRYVDEPPYFELRQVAPDGSGTSTLADAEVDLLLRRGIPVGVGGTVRLVPEEQPYGRCDAREVVPAGSSTEVSTALAAPVRSLAATEDGVVVVGVDVCPDDATWGDPGTQFELRRIDLTTGATTVLHVREPGEGDTFFEDANVVYAGGEFLVESVSPDGAYVAVAEPYTTEDTRYHVLDAVTGGEPLTFGSACPDPRDLVGPPQFVGDGRVVVARECSPVDGEVGGLIVELVSLETREPIWSVEVEGVAIDGYSHTVSLDAMDVEGRVWALVSGSAGVEQPIEAAAVTDGAELPLPGGAIVAFDPQELIEPWDPYPA